MIIVIRLAVSLGGGFEDDDALAASIDNPVVFGFDDGGALAIGVDEGLSGLQGGGNLGGGAGHGLRGGLGGKRGFLGGFDRGDGSAGVGAGGGDQATGRDGRQDHPES